MFIKKIALISVACIGAALTGCASMPGAYNGLGSDPMTMLIVDRSDDEPLTPEQYLLIQDQAKRCGARIDPQMSSPVEAFLTDGVVGGLASGLSLAQAAGDAFGADKGTYGTYGSEAAALPNAVNGATKWSYARATTTATCVETRLRDRELDTGNPDYHNLHVYVSLVRSNNRTNKPSEGLVPDWKGAKAGT